MSIVEIDHYFVGANHLLGKIDDRIALTANAHTAFNRRLSPRLFKVIMPGESASVSLHKDLLYICIDDNI
jgi:hypothetical protein